MADSALPPVERAEEEDHDLLTFNEAGARLLEEAHELDRQAGELERRAAEGETGLAEQIGRLRARVEALKQRHAINEKLAKEAPGAQGFLNYRPEQP